jgi:hypothetical protein
MALGVIENNGLYRANKQSENVNGGGIMKWQAKENQR